MMRNKAVLFVAALLTAYGLLALWQSVAYQTVWAFLVWSVPCFATAAGLVFSQRWSRYALYAIALCLVLGWAVYTAMYIMQLWPNCTLKILIKPLLLGLVLTTFSAWSSVVVHRHFKNVAQA